MLRVLLLDNRDSFVWNLAQAIDSLGARTHVVRSDAIRVDDVRAERPDALVLSPGPGRPEDAGICVAAVRALSGDLPILGVCLGHQAIGVAFGATVARSAPRHGKPSRIEHDGTGVFAGLDGPIDACRYHSLSVVEATLPAELLPNAWTMDEDRTLMGVRHREHPTFGVQFHPESFRSPDGPALLATFLERAS